MIVLCYHGISDAWSGAVGPHSLERQLRLLLDHGYRPASFAEAVLSPPAGKTVVVTFDDGYRSVVEDAFPILESLGVRGTVFVPTGFVGAEVAAWSGTDCWLGSAYEHELVPMTWDQLRMLRDAGWEIGSHTATHPHLICIGDEQLGEELVGSRSVIERELGVPCRSLAYPYGEADGRVERAAAAAGFEAACTLTDSFAPASPLAWPRIGIFRHDGPIRFRVKVSPLVIRLRSTPWWRLLRRGHPDSRPDAHRP
ncbi:MAG: polysaccharide deacetylase family protein [Gaiellaceae bacterium]